MSKKNNQWSEQEQKFLIQNIQTQIKHKKVDWENLSFLFNCHFSTQRSSKQCKIKYIDYLKNAQHSQRDPNQSLWTTEELSLFQNLYEQYGPCWSLLSSKFVNKSECQLKNLFNNSIRRGAKVLNQVQESILNRAQRSIKKNILLIMLNVVNQVQKMILHKNLSVNYDSMLFRFRSQLLKLCLRISQFSQDQLAELVLLIKNINIKIRCFGIFKMKLSKQWKINEKNFKYICQFDKVIKESFQIPKLNSCPNHSILFQEKNCESPFSLNSSFKFCEKLKASFENTEIKFKCDPMAQSTAQSEKGLFATQILDLPLDDLIVKNSG